MRGYHKPIMLAGGIGHVAAHHVLKEQFLPGALLIQLGGPGMLIGLGGCAASSMDTGTNADKASISIQFNAATLKWSGGRRKSSTACWQMERRGEANPILGHPRRRRGRFVERGTGTFAWIWLGEVTWNLRDIPSEEPGMSPRRSGAIGPGAYMFAIRPESLESFQCDLRARTLSVCGDWHCSSRGEQLVVDGSGIRESSG